jgi:hypothetical protein
MRFERVYCANWRVKWQAETDDGLTLLVVRDRRPLRWWWRLRRGKRNLAKGNARDTRDGIKRVMKAMRQYSKKHEPIEGEE